MASARPSAAASDVFPGAPHRRGAARIKSSLDRWPTPISPAQSKGKSMTVNIRNWQELKKPSNMEIKAGSDGKRMATLVAEKLERCYGLTHCNAQRRVRRSYTQRAAMRSTNIGEGTERKERGK